MFESHVEGVVDRGVELCVEVAYLFVPRQFAFGNVVECLFDAGGEVIVEDVGEIVCEEAVDHLADVGGHELAAL